MNCPHCQKANIYYDETLKVNQQIEDDVTKMLDEYQQQLDMKNQAKDRIFSPATSTKGISIIEDTFNDKDVPQKTSLKSVRGNQKSTPATAATNIKKIDPVSGVAVFEDDSDPNRNFPGP